MSPEKLRELKATALDCRKEVLGVIHRAGTSHLGSNFSCTEMMTAVFDKFDWDRDKFILSAGWKAATLYYFMWKNGRITEEQFKSYCQPGSDFIGLAEPIHPDIPFAGGSMGYGLAAGAAIKYAKPDSKVFVLESDGGTQTGLFMESAAFVGHKKIPVVLMVDYNGFQAMGKTDGILPTNNLGTHLLDWGFNVLTCEGNTLTELEEQLDEAERLTKYGPVAILCHTTKGKGWPKAENNNLYHYKHISDEEYQEALLCLT